MNDRKPWRQYQTTKAQTLLNDLQILADRARSAGFNTTGYILVIAAEELAKDIERLQSSKKGR
jgi:hypothetical protein